MRIKESAENYLETIFMLKKKNGSVRSIDIAHELSFAKASVSVAMKAFREENYITVDSDGNISLTEKGLAIAKKMYERHEIIAKFLINIGVEESTAYEDSCRMEHVISTESFMKIKEIVESN